MYNKKEYMQQYGRTHWPVYYQRNKTKLTTRNQRNNQRRYLKHKRMAIEYLGSKCSRCGYDECMAALDFHHKENDKKDKSVGNMLTSSWKKIEEELKKCTLLCANCHRRLHFNNRMADVV